MLFSLIGRVGFGVETTEKIEGAVVFLINGNLEIWKKGEGFGEVAGFDEKAGGSNFGLLTLGAEVAGAFLEGGKEICGRFLVTFNEVGELGENLGVGSLLSGVGEREKFVGPEVLGLLVSLGSEAGEFRPGFYGDGGVELADESRKGDGGFVVGEGFEVSFDLIPAPEDDVAAEFSKVCLEDRELGLVLSLIHI